MPILNEKQLRVLEEVLCDDLKTEISLYGAGRSGKTFLVCYYIMQRAIAYPGSFHLFIRATMNALTGGVILQTFPKLFKIWEQAKGVNLLQAKCDNGESFIYHRTTPINRYVLYNGSEIRFAGLDVQSTNAAAIDKILSQEYLTIVFEEATEIDFEVVDLAKSRLAQKAYHAFRKNPNGTRFEGVPKWLCTLNPRTFEDWDYVYFTEHKHPIEDTLLPFPERAATVHFNVEDNLENISGTYLDTLASMSTSAQKRFKLGEHSEMVTGEVFKTIYWEARPDINEFDKIVVYTDPSYKSGPKNDYKATAAIGRRKGAYWILTGRANQCTTSHMILNIHDVHAEIASWGWNKPIENWLENAGMPDDFEDAVKQHGISSGWVMPYKLDNRDKGDKFARIESGLEPLNRDGKLFFNSGIKSTYFGRLAAIQFLNFKHKMAANEHDDIPDAVHGGVTLMNIATIRPGQVQMHDQRANTRLG